MDQEFQIEERAGTAPPVIAVSGEIDVATAPQLRECLHRVIAQGESTIVLDLLGVTFLDSTALGVLVGALKRCREAGRRPAPRRGGPPDRQDLRDHRAHQCVHHRRLAPGRRRIVTDPTDTLATGDRIELRFPARGDLIVLARL